MNPIFSPNRDIEKTAILNWRMASKEDIRNLLELTEGFLASAIEIAKSCLQDNTHKKADILIFPMLANANHGLELYGKALIWTLNKLSGSDNKIEGKHNIDQIFQTVKAKIKSYSGRLTINAFNTDTLNLYEHIKELFAKIGATPAKHKMDFSRYPFSDKYEDHFYIGQVGNIEIDLENFVTRFEDIRLTLDNISSFLYYQELNQGW